MANSKYFNSKTLRFLLYEVHGVHELIKHERFQSYDKQSFDLLLDSVEDFSNQSLFPFIKDMDEHPSYFSEGKIIIHQQFESILKQAGEMGLIGATFDEKNGGLQLPVSLFSALYFIMEAANNHVTGYMGLTAGAANLILSFGSDQLKQTYVPKMLEMKWGGTMCLTEPQAGSSLSEIKTSAKPISNETFHISGQKIFISSGDHQYAENFVHLVLARIEGAPAGTKGVSLFVVPKFRLDESKLENNHVTVAGEFDKLGQRGYCTTHLIFGETGECRGWLLGQPNQGLTYMFQMMNEARIATGRMGTGIASAAYYASLQYAKERPQGRKLPTGGMKNTDDSQTTIINHPDVKRMLLHQKAIVEGCISLILQASMYVDMEMVSTGTEKDKYRLLAEILTPMAKTIPAESGQEAVSTGLQVLGGYGYMMDFILQQYYRDIRIISIYEGTTGIQSLDLLGRKATMHDGKALQLLAEEIRLEIIKASTQNHTQAEAQKLGKCLQSVQSVMKYLLPFAATGNHERFLADAGLFMEMMSKIVLGWQWLKIGNSLNVHSINSNPFFKGKLLTMQYFFTYELPKVNAIHETLLNNHSITIEVNIENLE